MRRALGMLLAVLMLTVGFMTAGAEGLKAPDYVMEGYDGSSAGHDWETNLFFQRMQEDTGISFEFRQFSEESQWKERKEALLQGENLPDVLFKAGLTDEETLAMAENDLLLDLTPYLEEYAPDLWKLLEAHPEWRKAITLPDGTIRALPSINELPANNLIWINQTWLNNLRLKMPENAEELTETLRAFKTGDPNRNGKADEVPLSVLGMWDLRFLGHAFGVVQNDYYIAQKDGKAVSLLTTENNRSFLNWLHQLWAEGLLDHTCFSTADSLRQVTDAKAVMTYGVFLSSSPLTVVPTEAMDQYTALAPLTYEGGQIYRDLLGPLTRGTFALLKNCPSPEKMVAWVNRLYTEEGSILIQVGRENEEYMWTEDGTWEWMQDLQTVANEVLPNATLSDGGISPGIITLSFQEKYADNRTGNLIAGMKLVQDVSVLPFPQVMMTAEDMKTLALLQTEIAPYAERKMAEFVTGDTPLDEAGWKAFAEDLEKRGLSRMTALWQKYVTEEGGD